MTEKAPIEVLAVQGKGTQVLQHSGVPAPGDWKILQTLRSRSPRAVQRKYEWTPAMDDQIREAYRLHVTTPRQVSIKSILGNRFNRPYWAVQQPLRSWVCATQGKALDRAVIRLLEQMRGECGAHRSLSFAPPVRMLA